MLRTILTGSLACTLACSDDGSFGRNPEPRPGDSDTAQTPPMLIGPGDTFSYLMFKTYDPNPVSSATAHEKSEIGHVCFKVTDVDDGYPQGRASSINAQVKVTGLTAGSDIFFEDQDVDPPAAALSTDVDAFMTPLWLDALTFNARGHGYLSPATVFFGTRQSIAPDPAQSLDRLPFFDARDSAAAHGWRGWSDWLVDFIAYFQGRFGAELNSPDLDFEVKSGLNCDTATSSATCPAAQCLWDFQTNQCVGQLSIDIAWRDNVSIPTEFASGPVIHRVRVGFTMDGWLRNFDEVIRPDTTADRYPSTLNAGGDACGNGGAECAPGGTCLDQVAGTCATPVDIESLLFTQCQGAGSPCAKAGFNSESWAGSECRF